MSGPNRDQPGGRSVPTARPIISVPAVAGILVYVDITERPRRAVHADQRGINTVRRNTNPSGQKAISAFCGCSELLQLASTTAAF